MHDEGNAEPMKQLDLFGNDETKKNVWSLFVDGASRNNPGPSGAGIYILKNDILFIKCGYYLGIKTNNQAEYLALLLGLFIVSEHAKPGDETRIVSDSLLMVRQIMGVYRVKQPHLQPLHEACQYQVRQLKATISHTLRAGNSEADEMANQGVDGKIAPPKNYLEKLKHYDIVL